jgi:hypothetical protein
VQVHHDEGVASRIDPESCAAACEGSSEALTGERTGQPLSRESTFSSGGHKQPGPRQRPHSRFERLTDSKPPALPGDAYWTYNGTSAPR